MPHNTIDYLKLAQHISGLCDMVSSCGVQLELRHDFGYFVRLCENLTEKPFPTAMFNPMHHYIGPENGLWIKGTNAEGDVVHVQALRYDDLTGTNLARTFEDMTAFYCDPSVSAPEGEYCRSFAPSARKITGQVVYHGELWLRPDMRGLELSRPLGRLAMALALASWNPDYYYAFMYQRSVDRGLNQRFGFWHTEPRAVYWVRPYRNEPLDVHLMWLERQDLLSQVDDWVWQNGEFEIASEIGKASQSGAAIEELRPKEKALVG